MMCGVSAPTWTMVTRNSIDALTATPQGNNQTLRAVTQVDSVYYTVSVDFNVSCTFKCVWSKNEFQVSAPGGTLAASSTPFEQMNTARGLTTDVVSLNLRDLVNYTVFFFEC